MARGSARPGDRAEPEAATVPLPSNPDSEGELADTVGAGPGPASLREGAVAGGRYELIAELGRGGHGVVFRAHDRHADQPVALKVLGSSTSEDLALLRRELAAARRVTHPGVVRLYDLANLDGHWALSMELVEGRSLEASIEEGRRFSADEIEALARALAEALAAAHAAGVTHRDLKPANILITASGEPKITDFGISRLHGQKALIAAGSRGEERGLELTREGAIVGTPLYMAPEQLRGSTQIGPRTDVYAFGLVIHELATGSVPHAAGTLEALLAKRAAGGPPPLAAARPDLPRRLTDAVERCLAPEASERFADGSALLAALAPPKSRPPPSLTRVHAARPAGRWAGVSLALGGTAVVVAAVLALRRGEVAKAPASGAPAEPPASAATSAVARSTAPPRFAVSNHRRLTTSEVCAEFPSFTPDGRSIVYDVTRGPRSDIVVRDLTTGEVRDLTRSPGWDFAARVSPDGQHVAFIRMGKGETATYLTDLQGSPARRVVAGELRPSFDPSGEYLWAGPTNEPHRIRVATGEVVERSSSPTDYGPWHVLELPDGRVVAMTMSFGAAIGGIALSDTARPRGWSWLFRGPAQEALALAPGGRWILAARNVITTRELFALSPDGAGVHSLAAAAIPTAKGVSVSPAGQQIAWSSCEGVTALVALTGGPPEPLFAAADWSEFDAAVGAGDHLALISDRGGAKAIWWVEPRAGGKAVQVGTPADPREIAAAAGKPLVAVSGAEGITLLDPTGATSPRRLTQLAGDAFPSFRAGDRELLFTRGDGAQAQVLSIALDGGEPKPLLPPGSYAASASPTRDEVVFLQSSGESSRVIQRDLRSGRERELLPLGNYLRPEISRDGRSVSVVRGGVEAVVIDLASGKVRDVAGGDGAQLTRAVLTRDNRLIANRVDWRGALWIADLDASASP